MSLLHYSEAATPPACNSMPLVVYGPRSPRPTVRYPLYQFTGVAIHSLWGIVSIMYESVTDLLYPFTIHCCVIRALQMMYLCRKLISYLHRFFNLLFFLFEFGFGRKFHTVLEPHRYVKLRDVH